MKKFFVLIPLIIALAGCEKDYDTVIQPPVANYQVTSITAFPVFRYFPGDSIESVNISFNSLEYIKEVSYNLFSPSGDKLTPSPVLLSINKNENRFSGVVTMRRDYPVGVYALRYYVADIYNNVKEAAVHHFTFDNGINNIPPLIANPFVDPDTVAVTDTTILTVTIAVTDSNGAADIEAVYFISYRPDSSTSNNPLFLSDDGIKDLDSWDETAGDGIYSQRITVIPATTKGTWRFEFTARDRSKALSNIISYNVLIQ